MVFSNSCADKQTLTETVYHWAWYGDIASGQNLIALRTFCNCLYADIWLTKLLISEGSINFF